jgi:3-methyl-2-oxobutanoate hydroxymethyltransferase
MSAQVQTAVQRLTAPDIQARKGQTPLVCLTAHGSAIAVLLDEVCDLILVGDSTGMVAHGMPNTIGVTVEMMILHGQAVVRSTQRAMIVVDLPFGAYEGPVEQAYENAVRILKETGAQAVKVEAGREIAETIAYLTRRGIPVVGHVGLRPQAVWTDGGFKAKGKGGEERDAVLAEAKAAEAAGAFALVLEGVAEPLARTITQAVAIPTIGIGASAHCDGQILVTEDVLGLFDWTPKFVRRYADLRGVIREAVHAYARDVHERAFPGRAETYFNVRAVSAS